jgi:hypothetical protein
MWALYQNLPWNNTIEEDTIHYSDLFAGGKGINVWPIVMLDNRNISINMGTEALVAG